MDTRNQARALMMRHTKRINHRQQSMLQRTASEIGADVDPENFLKGDRTVISHRYYQRNSSAFS